MSLSKTHPLFSTCASSPYEVVKASIQAKFLSGRARVEALTRHWDPSNRQGHCLLCRSLNPTLGNLEHFLLNGGCPALVEARLTMMSFIQSYLVPRPYLLDLFKSYWGVNASYTIQFLLDCSVLPHVISASQNLSEPVSEDIFYLTRTYIFKIYVTRKRLLLNC